MKKTKVFRHIAQEHINGAPANAIFDEIAYTLFRCLYIHKKDITMYDIFHTIHLN